jgi:hypothetical protein
LDAVVGLIGSRFVRSSRGRGSAITEGVVRGKPRHIYPKITLGVVINPGEGAHPRAQVTAPDRATTPAASSPYLRREVMS